MIRLEPFTKSDISRLIGWVPDGDFLLQWAVPRGFYIQLDGRAATYDKASWGVDESFLDGWIELGYRTAAFW